MDPFEAANRIKAIIISPALFAEDYELVSFDVESLFMIAPLHQTLTFDKFKNTTLHFLDINIASDGLGMYRKDTFTRQYTSFESFVAG